MASPSKVETATAMRNVRIMVKLFLSLNGAKKIPAKDPRLSIKTAVIALIQAIKIAKNSLINKLYTNRQKHYKIFLQETTL